MIFKVIAIILLLLITFNSAVTMLLLFGWIGCVSQQRRKPDEK